ncbi:MAG: AraC family transcriptional regulator [Cyclobacteriaceae bacterium]
MKVTSSQKPHLLKIIPPFEKSIVIKGDAIAWDNPWHYHPEIELLYCIKGKGTNFIGNSIRNIEEGELLLIGKNLPHTRQRDRNYYMDVQAPEPESIVVQFREDFLGKDFLGVREFSHISELFNRALRGLQFSGATRNSIAEKLALLKQKGETSAILGLLDILDELARSRQFIFLNPETFVSVAHEKSSQKINKVYHYTIENFRQPISLSDVAALTNHSIAGFCRYFKTRTRKSYFQYLTEIRITYACELLRDGHLDVTRVCFASGFNNLSHFHKQFKKIVKLTPSEYRGKSLGKVVDEAGGLTGLLHFVRKHFFIVL